MAITDDKKKTIKECIEDMPSLSELRKMQTSKFATDPIVTVLPPDYAKKVFRESKPVTVDSILAKYNPIELRKAKRQLMSFDDAKRLWWGITVARLNAKGEIYIKNADHIRHTPDIISLFIQEEKETQKLSRGVLLGGETGTGKTFLIETMQIFCREMKLETGFKKITCKALVELVERAKNKHEVINKYSKGNWFFDDLGKEKLTIKDYGNEINVMESVLDSRYDNFEKFGQITHISTNLDDTKIIEMYGKRIYDRMIKMFNWKKFSSDSLRK